MVYLTPTVSRHTEASGRGVFVGSSAKRDKERSE